MITIGSLKVTLSLLVRSFRCMMLLSVISVHTQCLSVKRQILITNSRNFISSNRQVRPDTVKWDCHTKRISPSACIHARLHAVIKSLKGTFISFRLQNVVNTGEVVWRNININMINNISIACVSRHVKLVNNCFRRWKKWLCRVWCHDQNIIITHNTRKCEIKYTYKLYY